MKKLFLILAIAFAGIVSFNTLGISPINSAYAVESQDEWEQQGWIKRDISGGVYNNQGDDVSYYAQLYYKNKEYMLVILRGAGKVRRAQNKQPFKDMNIPAKHKSFTCEATCSYITYYFNL